MEKKCEDICSPYSMRVASSFFPYLFLIWVPIVAQIGEDNEVIGNPEIGCHSDTIEMQFKTKKKFGGKVYVKGNYQNPECRVDYGRQSDDGKPIGGIRLNHGACNMDRQRMITPEGMMFSTILIISFHPLFITKVDRAYHIKCMYKESNRMVTASLDVSQLPTESVTASMNLPICSYTIRKDSLDGPILKVARVGDQVVHRWQCDSPEYGVLVHSCIVEDGQGEKQSIIDEKGCHTDRLLLGDPTYVESLNMAYREAFVFKFADRVAVRFQCGIRLCIKEDGGCDGITPPICFNENQERSNQNQEITNNSLHRLRRQSSSSKDADLISQTVYVLDADVVNNTDSVSSALSSVSNGICLSPRSVAWTAVLLAMALIVLLASVIWALHQRFNMMTLTIEKRGRAYF